MGNPAYCPFGQEGVPSGARTTPESGNDRGSEPHARGEAELVDLPAAGVHHEGADGNSGVGGPVS
jgi:hypothetical protein